MSNLLPSTRKTYVLPAVVSAFFPGFGQVLKGQFIKAITIWVAGALVAFFFGWLTAIPGAIFYLANILDAWLSTSEENLFK